MRYIQFEQSKEILSNIAKSYDGKDRWYLEALGTGASNKETRLYSMLLKSLGHADGAKWDAGDKTAFIVDGKYWVNNHAHVVKPNTEKLLNKWLTYYLCGIDLKPWVTGMTVPKLNQGQLKSIPIPLPPLPEQERIVAKLDAAFAEIDESLINVDKAIQAAEDGLANLVDDKTKNKIEWNEYKVSYLGLVQTGNTPKTSNKENFGLEILKVEKRGENTDHYDILIHHTDETKVQCEEKGTKNYCENIIIIID